jgi:hypothetical protein
MEDIPQVSDEENEQLVKPFSKEEVRHAVFQMDNNKAPGPDGFPVSVIRHVGISSKKI